MWRNIRIGIFWSLSLCWLVIFTWVFSYAFMNPNSTRYMRLEADRLGGVEQTWREIDQISAHMLRAVVAAEDANFCLHHGIDFAAVRLALADGSGRGASTISQQVVKNVFLWHGRSWVRKALEAALTGLVEIIWSKQRILEVYLNVAEFDEGVFGVGAAAQSYFGVSAQELTLTQAAQLAAILPSPKTRSTGQMTRRTRQIVQGAETILVDGRSACFDIEPAASMGQK